MSTEGLAKTDAELDLLGAGAAVAGLVIGAIGPWATVLGLASVSGLESWNDGWIVLGSAVFAGACLYRRLRGQDTAVGLVLAGLVAFTLGVYHWQEIDRGGGAYVSAGWGLILATVSGGGLIFFGARLGSLREPVWDRLVWLVHLEGPCSCGSYNERGRSHCERCGAALPPSA